MKNNKAPGPNDLPVDIWKLEGLWNKAVMSLTDFFNAITEAGHEPSAWAMSIAVPFFKNRETLQCAQITAEFSSSYTLLKSSNGFWTSIYAKWLITSQTNVVISEELGQLMQSLQHTKSYRST